MSNNLTPEQIEHINRTVVILGKLQSTLHDVDKMLETPVKRELKNRLTNFQSWLEGRLNHTTKEFNLDASESLTEFTRVIDQVGDEFKIVIDEAAHT